MAVIHFCDKNSNSFVITTEQQLLTLADSLADGFSEAIKEFFISKKRIKASIDRFESTENAINLRICFGEDADNRIDTERSI